MGVNTTMARNVLDQIKPSLKKAKDDDGKSSTTSSKSSNKSGNKPTPPKPAKKEDVVFEITSNDFQKIVLESPVPVLLDIYADWCGPCKQLGPILEEAAVKAGGMFRVVKVNSDKDRALAGILEVNSLPTVFGVSNGRLNDRFLGMLPGEQIQQFLVRLVTGYGERVQSELSEAELSDLTFKVSNYAGKSPCDI